MKVPPKSEFPRLLELADSYGIVNRDGVNSIIFSREFGGHISKTSHELSDVIQEKYNPKSEGDYMDFLLIESTISWMNEKDSSIGIPDVEGLCYLAHVIWKATATPQEKRDWSDWK